MARRTALALFLSSILFACTDAPAPAVEDVAETTEDLTVCAGVATVPGIDVSHYQQSIDWAAVAASGIGFGIAQIGDGTYQDPTFQTNWAGMKANGLIRGAYQFYEPTVDSAVQANIVVAAVGQLGQGDLPVALDVEWTNGSPNAAAIQTWVDIVTQGTGKRPMIYTAFGYWNQYFNGEFSNLDLWVANWGVACPGMPDSWNNWLVWQPGGGPTAGIAGDVDQDVFNGSLQDLQMLADADLSQNCRASAGGACAHFGCHCADDQCSGGFCPGSGCTAQHTSDCQNFGCQCVDGQCGGGFCPGSGCTAKEELDCQGQGCGCVDHACAGGACGGTGCTAKEQLDCSNQGQDCAMGQCTPKPAGSGAGGGGATTATGAGTGTGTGAGSGAGGGEGEGEGGGGGNGGGGVDPGPGASVGVTSTGTVEHVGNPATDESDTGVHGSCGVAEIGQASLPDVTTILALLMALGVGAARRKPQART